MFETDNSPFLVAEVNSRYDAALFCASETLSRRDVPVVEVDFFAPISYLYRPERLLVLVMALMVIEKTNDVSFSKDRALVKCAFFNRHRRFPKRRVSFDGHS